VGMVLIPGNFLGNASFKNEMASPITSLFKFKFLVIVRIKSIKDISNYFWVFTLSAFIRRDGICSVRCILTLKRLIYEGTNGMKPLVTEFVM
jgi:hypothetical protein